MRTKNLNVTRPDHLNICQKVKSILKKHKNNNTFVVAVSGGSDSLALVSIIKNLIQENKYKFFFATNFIGGNYCHLSCVSEHCPLTLNKKNKLRQ